MQHRPKKRFGQNFLRPGPVVDRILAAATLGADSRVLEIGPGRGVLTDRLLEVAAEVAVMEIDRDLLAALEIRNEPRLRVLAGDCLQLDWRALLEHPPYTLVANLPYNISSQVLFKVLDHVDLFERLVLMFQKEVADRLCAPPGTADYGILSVLCRYRFAIRRVVDVPPGAFVPAPKVHSAVLRFDPLDAPPVDLDDEDRLRRVVRAAFGQRRKTLRNALTGGGFAPERVDRALVECAIDSRRRGETLSLEEFAALSNALGEIGPRSERSHEV